MNDSEFRNKQTKFYNSKEWRKVRNVMISKSHGICSRCGKPFNSRDLIVHHIHHLDETNINNPEVALNLNNLEVLCWQCHNSQHAKNEDLNRDMKFDDKGNIIDVN
jgi:5-methylcytosine-specific restriction endonuclease McrA